MNVANAHVDPPKPPSLGAVNVPLLFLIGVSGPVPVIHGVGTEGGWGTKWGRLQGRRRSIDFLTEGRVEGGNNDNGTAVKAL